MEESKFDGMYKYMGFVIYNGGSKHEWDIEPVNWDIQAIEKFKHQAECFGTLASAKRWIRSNADKINENDFL